MFRSTNVFLYTVTAMMVLACASFAASTSPSKISVDQDFIDFGYVPFDFNVVHIYTIYNTGKGDLILHKFVPNCDCTSVYPSDTLIKPGDSAEIKLMMGTEQYYGPNTRHVAVHSNDPVDSVILLEFHSNIGSYPKQFRINPISLFFLPGHTSKTVNLANFSGDDVDYKVILEKDSLLTVSPMNGEIETDKPTVLTITPKADIPRGTHETNLTILYDTDDKTKITIPVKIVRY